ncbi:MAG: hypothetical protein RLZZ501_1372 [Pseudomonadota bacterium]|jgi:hypothetical protein
MMRFLVLFALFLVLIWLAARRAADLAARLGLGRERERPAARDQAAPQPPRAEAMIECPICGVWQPSGHRKPCGRPDCPY